MAENNIIKEKVNIFDGFNKLNYAITRPVLDVEIIEGILSKYKIQSSFLIRRLYSYIYNYPWILSYFNKYMNYLGIMTGDIVEFIKSYRYILSMNGVLDSRRFYFLKMAAGKDDLQGKIIDLLNKYFIIKFNEHFNYKELLFYYNLYLNGIITNQDIYEIDLIVNNNEQTIKLSDFKPEKNEEKSVPITQIIKQYTESSRGVDFINNEIYKKKLELCSNCQYSGRETVPCDGNVKDINDVDVVIVNLHPDLNDLKEKRTFREKNIVRQNISLFPKNIKWLLVNLTPCAFKSKSELGKDLNEIKEHLNNGCNRVVFDFIKNNIKPRFTILIGQEVTSVFLPAAEFEETLGVLTDNQYISVLHPNSMKQVKAQLRGKKYWEFVQNTIKEHSESGESVPEPPKTAAVNEDPIIPEPEVKIERHSKNNKYLLLDVKEIENGKSVLMVFTDEEGNKHYEKKRNVTTGYVKQSSFKDCGILTDNVDIEFTMTKSEKFQLIKLLREKMSKLKGS